MLVTEQKQHTNAPRNTNTYGQVRVAAPIYIGLQLELAKKILDVIRTLCTEGGTKPAPAVGGSGITVQHSGTSEFQLQLERRLRIDLKTLRMVLHDSWNRGINLDLALRIQVEVKDHLIFIDREMVQDAISKSLDHYDYFSVNVNDDGPKTGHLGSR